MHPHPWLGPLLGQRILTALEAEEQFRHERSAILARHRRLLSWLASQELPQEGTQLWNRLRTLSASRPVWHGPSEVPSRVQAAELAALEEAADGAEQEGRRTKALTIRNKIHAHRTIWSRISRRSSRPHMRQLLKDLGALAERYGLDAHWARPALAASLLGEAGWTGSLLPPPYADLDRAIEVSLAPPMSEGESATVTLAWSPLKADPLRITLVASWRDHFGTPPTERQLRSLVGALQPQVDAIRIEYRQHPGFVVAGRRNIDEEARWVARRLVRQASGKSTSASDVAMDDWKQNRPEPHPRTVRRAINRLTADTRLGAF